MITLSDAPDNARRYRKKPVVIRAWRWDGEDMWGLQAFCGDAVIIPDGEFPRIRTMEGDMTVNPGDYVIRGVRGEFYPCNGDIFRETYEEVK